MPISIRFRLLLLVLAVLLPAVALAAWVIWRTYAVERDALERNLRDTTRALSMVVDRELTQRAAIARVLSTSRTLEAAPLVDAANLASFEQQARRALQGLSGWVELESATQLLLTTRIDGSPPPQDRPPGAAPLHEQPRVSALELARGPAHASIVHPVQRDGRTLLNVIVTMQPAELQQILVGQRLPAGWVGAIVDSMGAMVAREPDGAKFVGGAVAPEFRDLLAAHSEGLFHFNTRDGQPMTAYYSTSPQNWTYVTAMPQRLYAGEVPETVARLVMAALLLLGLSVFGALWVARRIVGPVNSLKETAARMQAGLPVQHRATGIEECDGVARALAEAAETMQNTQADLERQVAQAVAQARAAEQRVSHSQRVEALGRLTGGVAHDFNNLLGVISNSAHLIQRYADAPETRMPLAAMLRAVESGSRLTRHLLRFAGRHPAQPTRLDLANYLPEALELMKVVLGSRIEITATVAAGMRPVLVDLSELELALINLALNCRDAMPEGGRVWIEAVDATDDDRGDDLAPGDYVAISVNDNGVGIDESLVDRVFEPFFTTKSAAHGLGLGLSQVHGFCLQAGGRARLASTRGVGTALTMVLPAAMPDSLLAGAPGAAADPRMQGVRVLLVEDNEELGNVTAMLLASYGCRVEQARSPDAALRMAAESAFDIVLSDVVMPGETNGIALARQLRRRHPRLPIVLISGYSNALASASDFTVLRKPCAPEALIAALAAEIANGAIAPQQELP